MTFLSRCPNAKKLTESTGKHHWCDWCDRCDVYNKPRNRYTDIVKLYEKKTSGHGEYSTSTYTYIVSHVVRCQSDKEFLCDTCHVLKPVREFTNAQLSKGRTRKCLECQKTCPVQLKLSADKAAKKKYRDTAKEKNKTVSEKLNKSKEYFLQLPIDMLVACLWFIMSSPPPAEGPHLLAYQADPTADPIWVPMCGRYSDHQKTIDKATRLVLVSSDMCPTQIRLNKFVKKVDMSLQFLLLIIGSIAKLPLKVFSQRKFESGQDNSVNVHDEKCGCGKDVLSNKALPYCPSCICEEIREVTGTSEPPKYNAMTNSVVDWARASILEFYSRTEITDAIREVVSSFFWKEVVEFAMKYEMEAKLMRIEKLSTMCSICGGPCGVFSYFETTADTLTFKKLSPLPWQPVSAGKSISDRVKSTELFCSTVPLLVLPNSMSPSSLFDLNGAAEKQINNAEKSIKAIQENLELFKKESC